MHKIHIDENFANELMRTLPITSLVLFKLPLPASYGFGQSKFPKLSSTF